MHTRKRKNTFSITKKTKGGPTGLPFAHIKEAVLGKVYTLSLVFIGDKRAHTLNKRYRKKDRPANILSFPLSKDEGEILINIAQAKREARAYKKKYRTYVGSLFIHGLFHLKGYTHSSTMEKEEKKMRKRFRLE